MKTHWPDASRTLKQLRGLARALIVACAAFATAPAWAAPGNTAWTSIYNINGELNWPSVMTVSGNTAYAAISGPYNGEPSSHADVRLRAFDIPTGHLLWENVWTALGELDNTVKDIAASGGRVFIAASRGDLANTGGNYPSYDWAVQAFGGNSGTVLWEDHCPDGSADRVLATRDWVYVAGACTTGTRTVVRVRAYAAATGKLRWETQIPALSHIWAITLSGNKLLVTGPDSSTGESLLVRAYGIARGNLLWQRTPATPQGAFVRVDSAFLAATSGTAYLAWGASNGQTAVVAYYTSTGRVRWQSYVNEPIAALTLAQGWLYVAKAGGESMVSAYNASSGLLLWQDHPGTPAAPFAASALAVGGNQLFVGGNALHPLHESSANYVIRAYTLSGKLLWADDVPTPASGGAANVTGIGWSDGITVTTGTGYFANPTGGYSLVWQVQGNLAPARNHASFRSP